MFSTNIKKYVALSLVVAFLFSFYQPVKANSIANKKDILKHNESLNQTEGINSLIDICNVIADNNKVSNEESSQNIILSNSNDEENSINIDDSVYKEKQEIYVNTVSSIKSLSTATKEEILIISEYWGIDDNILKKAEKLGYSVTDSIIIAKIILNTNISLEEFAIGLSNYNDIKSFFKASKEYSNFIKAWEFSDKTLEEIKICFLEGLKINELEQPSIIGEVFNVNLSEIIKKDNELINLKNLEKEYSIIDIQKLYNFISSNKISSEWFFNYTKSNNISWEDFYNKIQNYYDSSLKTISIDEKDVNTKTYTQMTQTTDDEYKAPFSYQDYGQDKVEMNTGNLIVENEDVFLPGKNGLDLILKSRYDSGDQVIGEIEYVQNSSRDTFYNIDVLFDIYEHGILVTEGVLDRHYENIDRVQLERLEDIYDGIYNPRYETENGEHIEIYYLDNKSQYSRGFL